MDQVKIVIKILLGMITDSLKYIGEGLLLIIIFSYIFSGFGILIAVGCIIDLLYDKQAPLISGFVLFGIVISWIYLLIREIKKRYLEQI